MTIDDALEVEVMSDEEREQDARFRTYLHYLTVLSDALREAYADPGVLIRKVVGSCPYEKIQGGQCPDLSAVERWLRNAWLTEIQLYLSPQHEELLPYSNHWAPVQLYYAVYLACRALLAASGQVVPPRHAQTLAAVNKELKNRPELFPLPWRALCVGDPKTASQAYLSLPPETQVEPVSPLSAPWRVPFWGSFCMFLRTTRMRQISKRIDEWKRQNHRRRIKASERSTLVANLPPTSIFDCLYRLRVRSNYADADPALWGLSGLADAKAFGSSIRVVAWNSLLVLEVVTARYVGKSAYQDLVANFLRRDVAAQSEELVAKRWGHIQTAFARVQS